jgi:hypothetical protein
VGAFSDKDQHGSLLFVRLQLTWPEDFGILNLEVEIGPITLNLFHKLKSARRSQEFREAFL